MAPALVQTKHSVVVNTTSASADLIHSSIAGPGTPSLSPKIITFFPLSILLTPPNFFNIRKNILSQL